MFCLFEAAPPPAKTKPHCCLFWYGGGVPKEKHPYYGCMRVSFEGSFLGLDLMENKQKNNFMLGVPIFTRIPTHPKQYDGREGPRRAAGICGGLSNTPSLAVSLPALNMVIRRTPRNKRSRGWSKVQVLHLCQNRWNTYAVSASLPLHQLSRCIQPAAQRLSCRALQAYSAVP